MFRTDGAALTYKSTLPDSLITGNEFLTDIPSLIPSIHIIPLAEGNGGGSDKGGIEGIDGTSSITKQAVNAHRVLLEVSQFSGRLKVFTFIQWFLLAFLPDNIWLYIR
jgi:hypothetical protein